MLSLLLLSILLFVDLGAVGLALAWACGFPLAYIVVLRRNCRLFHINIHSLVKQFLPVMLAGTFMLIVVFALKQFTNEISVFNMFSQIVLGGISFSLSLIFIDRSALIELKNLIKR